MAADAQVVRKWLQALGVLVGPGTPQAEARKTLETFAPVLAMAFDEPMFCDASMEYVAGECTYFPNYRALRNHLREWARDEYRPGDKLALTGPADLWRAKVNADKAEAQRDWADEAVVLKAVRDLDDHPWRQRLGPLLGAMVLRHAPQNERLLPPEFVSDEAQLQADETWNPPAN
jgi:hypothetical protein